MIPTFLEKYNRLQGQEKFVKTGHCNVLLLYIEYLLLGFEILLYPTPASKAFHCQDYQNSENIKHSRSWEILLEYCQKEKLCWGKLFDFSMFQTLLSRMKTIVQRVEVWINWIVFMHSSFSLCVFLQQNLEGLDMDTEKKSLVSREIRSFRDTYRVSLLSLILCNESFCLHVIVLCLCVQTLFAHLDNMQTLELLLNQQFSFLILHCSDVTEGATVLLLGCDWQICIHYVSLCCQGLRVSALTVLTAS